MSSENLRQDRTPQHASQATPILRPTRRSPAGSPIRRRIQQPLTIRMNLTERQMNKITEAISHKVDNNPKKQARMSQSKSISPTKEDCRSDSYILPSKTYEENLPRPVIDNKAPANCECKLPNEIPLYDMTTLAKRRNQVLPPPIETSSSVQKSKKSTTGKNYHPLETPFSDGEHSLLQENVGSGISSSHYGSSGNTKDTFHSEESGRQVNEAIASMYNSWANIQTPQKTEFPQRQQSLAQRPRPSEITVDNTSWHCISSPVPINPSPHPAPREATQNPNFMLSPSSQFSPLPLYFRGQSFPNTKMGGKTMIGCNGWLESTERTFEDGKKPQSKRMAFIESIKRMAKDVTAELNPSFRRTNLAPSGFTSPQVAISLNAREQSLLYCELEFHLTSSLNDYLIAEFEKGHLIPDNLKKISDFWLQHGRPRVISFRYDLETQLELIALHLNEFNFYGRRQSNPSEISGLLHAMKINARAMRVRTFCQPDSVIAKQLIDSQSLFNLLDVSHAQQLALAEIAHFFKMVIERELADREKPARDDAGSSIHG